MNINKLFFAFICIFFINTSSIANPSQSFTDRLTKLGLGTSSIALGTISGTVTYWMIKELTTDKASLYAWITTGLSAGFAGKLTVLGLSTLAHGIKGHSMNFKNNLPALGRTFLGSSLLGASVHAFKVIQYESSINSSVPRPVIIGIQCLNAGIGAIGLAQTIKGLDQVKQEFETSK